MSAAPLPAADPGLRVRLYTPHAGQWPLHQSTARFRIATCGRRFGKTMSAVNETAKIALGERDQRTAWIAPTYQQTKIAFRWLVREFRGAMKEPPSISELRIPWWNDSVTQCRSADNYDGIRGESFHFLVGDEFAMWAREAWEAAVRPTLADTKGRALLVGTPLGRNHFYELWARGQDRQAWPDYESWQFPTASNPFIDRAEIEEARASLPAAVFQQEYEAAFLEDSAGVFRNIRACERGGYEDPKPGATYVVGWDPARKQDASVLYVLDCRTGHVVHRDRLLETAWPVQLARVEMLAKRYNNALVLMDSTGVGDPLLPQVQAMGVAVEGYHFTPTSKQQLVEHLAVAIEQERISWPLDPVLRHELSVFRYETTRAGHIRYSAPEGMHDDMVIALALAVWAQPRGLRLVLGSQQARREPLRVPRGGMP